jgi:hypothetical protein
MAGTIYKCRPIPDSALMVELGLNEPSVARIDGDDYRDMAVRLRELACLTGSAGIRKQLVTLAKRYDGVAGHLDNRALSRDQRRGRRGRSGGLLAKPELGRGTSRRTSLAGLSSRNPS